MFHRRELVKSLLADRPENLLVVTGLGSSAWDVSAAGLDDRNFCFIGAMGQAGPFALGLAMSQPHKRVLLIAGDGEILMALGALSTIANQAPPNLAIVCLDNESYLETGGQPTATAGRTNLEMVAKGCGFTVTGTFSDPAGLPALKELAADAAGPVFIVAKIIVESSPLVFPATFDGATAMNAFKAAATS